MPGSNKFVWWRCKYGHSWRATIHSRVDGTGCPVCANRKLCVGVNDLKTRYPDLAEQWDYERNPATPDQIVFSSSVSVWWICKRGHSWKASAESRTRTRSGCPYCNGKKVMPGFNDLASQHPQIAAQWDNRKNETLRPNQVTAFSNRFAWWLCALGHSYRSRIASRTAYGNACPYCAGRRTLLGFNDLNARFPDIAAQWHPTLNAPLTPKQVTWGSSKRVWWICNQGHIWKAVISSRTGSQKCGCPVCAGHTRLRANTPP